MMMGTPHTQTVTPYISIVYFFRSVSPYKYVLTCLGRKEITTWEIKWVLWVDSMVERMKKEKKTAPRLLALTGGQAGGRVSSAFGSGVKRSGKWMTRRIGEG